MGRKGKSPLCFQGLAGFSIQNQPEDIEIAQIIHYLIIPYMNIEKTSYKQKGE